MDVAGCVCDSWPAASEHSLNPLPSRGLFSPPAEPCFPRCSLMCQSLERCPSGSLAVLISLCPRLMRRSHSRCSWQAVVERRVLRAAPPVRAAPSSGWGRGAPQARPAGSGCSGTAAVFVAPETDSCHELSGTSSEEEEKEEEGHERRAACRADPPQRSWIVLQS